MNWRIKGPLTDEVKKGIYQKGVLQANNDSLKIAESKISGLKDVDSYFTDPQVGMQQNFWDKRCCWFFS